MKNLKAKLLVPIVGVCALLIFVSGISNVQADTADTSVTVGNSSPSFTVTVAENPASDSTTPTNAGSDVTFQATATDANGEDYYLAICTTNAITATNGGAPTCTVDTWCISSATASGAQATCAYETENSDAESNAWFAFVCDGNSTAAACSSSAQGTGASGSPFKVNHAPAFTGFVINDGPDTYRDPGDTITWTTTASDSDVDGTADTVKLVVCETSGFSNGDCTGEKWCESSFVASNPSCQVELTIPFAAGAYDAYPYIIDNHLFESTGTPQGVQTDVLVDNVLPVISSISLNAGADIILTENTTTSVELSATVTDNNGCQDISNVTTSLYRSAITYANCDAGGDSNANNCYPVVSCSVVPSGNTCDGASDASADYECTINVQYHTDPTDAGTQFPAQNWLTTFAATGGGTATETIGTGVEVLSLLAYDVTGSIPYGSLGPGQSNDPLSVETTYTAVGNVGIDAELSGSAMCTDYPTCSVGTPIGVGQQRHALAVSTAYASGTQLTGTATDYGLNVPKTTTTGAPETGIVYWGIEIPVGTVSGSYTGENTLGAVASDASNW